VSLPFDAAAEEQDLRDYLGAEFELERLQRYQEQLDAEFEQVGDEQRFYRTSRGYLYNLTAFAMTGTKLPYLQELVRQLPAGARLLDYGCGIGSDGLLLLRAGFGVEFADFENPSTEYLRWRLARHGLSAAVHDLDREVPGGFDATYAFDVIEHVEDPFAFLDQMEQRARLVEVNFLEPIAGDQDLHHELPVGALLEHCAQHRLRGYRFLYGRSHLVLYEAGTTGSPLLNRARIAAERLALRVGRRATPR